MTRGSSDFSWSILCVLISFIVFGFHSNAQNTEKHLDEQLSNYSSSIASFPTDFLFGAATSAYQVEGAWNGDGKGENIWDRMVHTRPELINNGSTGDVACDSYHLFREDVALLKDVGFQVYRFSISWARILPNGEITNVNQAGVNYYHALIDELLKHGIQPMVTIYHWDLPQRLQDMGGWLNPLIIDFMEDYADLLFQLYGEKVKLWITINEPKVICNGYSFWIRDLLYAPGLYLDSPANYIVAYNLLRAHARIYRLYDEKFRAAQNGKISLSFSLHYYTPKTNATEDVEAAERAWAFHLELFAHPIYSENGDFPETVKRIVAENSKQEGRRRSRLPQFTREEIESLKGSSDFFAVNHYLSKLVSAEKRRTYSTLFEKDTAVKYDDDPKWPRNHSNFTVVPWGLRELLRLIKDKYNNPPVFITENGQPSGPGRVLNDVERVDFFRGYLREVLNAKEQFGCNVIGYLVWSLMDNLEWIDGYEFVFGIYDVDFTDPARKRTAKSSAEFFKELLKTRTIPT